MLSRQKGEEMLNDVIQLFERWTGRHLATGDVTPSIDLGNLFLVLIALFTVTVGIVTALVIWLQTRANKGIARKSFAWNLYVEYLKLSLTYPEFGMGIYNPDDPVSEGQYDTFISLMLYSIEEILRISSRRERSSWSQSFRYQAGIHAFYIKKILHKSLPESDENYRPLYDRKTLKVIDDMFEEKERLGKKIEMPRSTKAPKDELLEAIERHNQKMDRLKSLVAAAIESAKDR
jgi:hypothetical protein